MPPTEGPWDELDDRPDDTEGDEEDPHVPDGLLEIFVACEENDMNHADFERVFGGGAS